MYCIFICTVISVSMCLQQGTKPDVTKQKRKFSSFFRSLVIELDKDLYGPDNHLVEVCHFLQSFQTVEKQWCELTFLTACRRFSCMSVYVFMPSNFWTKLDLI